MNINDIIEYIEKNIQYINQPQLIKLNDSDIQREEKIVPLVYEETTELINLPTNLNSIFNSMMVCRTGVITNVDMPSDVNITYVSSIFFLLDNEFNKMTKIKQANYIESFIRKLHKESRIDFENFDYKTLGWNKKEFRNNIQYFRIGRDLMRYITDYLHINVFILDVANDSLIYVGEKVYTKYKKNVFLLKVDDNTFEPLKIGDMSVIDYNSSIINKLINSRFLVERLDCDLTHEEEFNFVVGEEDITKYIDGNVDTKEQNEKTSECLSDDMNCFEEDNINEDVKKEYNISNGVTDAVEFTEEDNNIKVDSSYTVAKLKEIALSKGIVLSYKKDGKSRGKTKGMLIEEINSM